MENNKIELENEQPQKIYKKHPKIALVLMIIAILTAIGAIVLCALSINKEIVISPDTNNPMGPQKFYSGLFIASLLCLLLSVNLMLKVKGFWFIFYPIVLIYMIITTYAFKLEDVAFQYTIILTIIAGAYFLQSLYEFIAYQRKLYFIVGLLFLVSNIVFVSIGYLNHALMNTLASASFTLVVGYELLLLIKEKDTPEAKVEDIIKETIEETTEESKD